MIKMIFNLFLTCVCASFLISCAETENDKLGDAQFCLDGLKDNTEAGINDCLKKIDGITTKQAYLLRCSAGFIQEGFSDPNTLMNVVNGMSKSTNSNPTATILSVLIFKSKTGSTTALKATNNENFAVATQNYCIDSGNSGMILISSFASMATSIAAATANLASGASDLFSGNASASDIKSAVANATPSVLGNTAIIAYQTNCTGTIDSTKVDLCKTLSSAVTAGNNDPTAIGTALQNQIKL